MAIGYGNVPKTIGGPDVRHTAAPTAPGGYTAPTAGQAGVSLAQMALANMARTGKLDPEAIAKLYAGREIGKWAAGQVGGANTLQGGLLQSGLAQLIQTGKLDSRALEAILKQRAGQVAGQQAGQAVGGGTKGNIVSDVVQGLASGQGAKEIGERVAINQGAKLAQGSAFRATGAKAMPTGAGAGANVIGGLASSYLWAQREPGSKGAQVGSQIGSTIGSVIPYIGSMVGGLIGGAIGEKFDPGFAQRSAVFGNQSGGWVLGESKLGKFGVSDDKWFSGDEQGEGLKQFGQYIARLDDAAVNALKMTPEQIEAAKQSLSSGYRYNFGMEKTGAGANPRIAVDRMAKVLDAAGESKVADVLRGYAGGFDNLDKALASSLQMAQARRAGKISDAQLDEMRKQSLAGLSKGYVESAYSSGDMKSNRGVYDRLIQVSGKDEKRHNVLTGGGLPDWLQRVSGEFSHLKNDAADAFAKMNAPAAPVGSPGIGKGR